MEKIPLTLPYLNSLEQEACVRVLKSGWITEGPEVELFESEFANEVGAKHAAALSSATAALHLALKVLGVREGDEVITPSHSFLAVANSIRYVGAIPVFVDIEENSFNLDPREVEKALSPKTRAILAVHQIGMPADLSRLAEVAGEIPIVEDAACAVGSEILVGDKWEKIGRPHGKIACFSFHPRKVLTTGDGGMLTTNDPEIDQRVRRLRNHGVNLPPRERMARNEEESYEELGFNYRMTDIEAAIGRVQLKKLPEILTQRRALAKRYFDALEGVSELILPKEPRWAKSNWQSFCVGLRSKDQSDVIQSARTEGIQMVRGVQCAHLEPAYRVEPSRRLEPLAHSERARNHFIQIPLYPGMSDEAQDRVIAFLKSL